MVVCLVIPPLKRNGMERHRRKNFSILRKKTFNLFPAGSGGGEVETRRNLIYRKTALINLILIKHLTARGGNPNGKIDSDR